MIARPYRRPVAGIAVLISLISAGCAVAPLPVAVRPSGTSPPEAVLYLIGDAGAATPDLPVLRQLAQELLRQPAGVPILVAFLGDNVYEAGVRDAWDPGFEGDSLRLESQIEVLRGTSAAGLFLPGNHDWADGGPEGIARLRNQAEFIGRRARKGVDAVMAPRDGCPGPLLRNLGESAALVLLDTQWWLQTPRHRINPRCPNQTEDEIVGDLRTMIASVPDDRPIVVLGHHPLESYGPHGGYFSARQILFPLTDVEPWLYVPLPFVVPAARTAGISNQDLPGPRYVRMRDALATAFRAGSRRPLFYAAGHEHSLQVSDGRHLGLELHVVSGAGSKLTHVTDGFGADFVAGRGQGELGFMRVEFLRDGRVLLSAFTDGTKSCADDGRDGGCDPRQTLRYARFIP